MKRFVRHWGGLLGLALLLLVLTGALFAPAITRQDPTSQDLVQRNKPPAWVSGGTREHLLGTDNLGRDMYSRIVYGARVSVLVGISAVLIQTVLGVLFGLAAGYFGGRVDTAIMRFSDVWLAIPFLILAMAIMVVLGPGLLNTIFVLGITGWVTYARVVRAEVLSVRERDFITAARSLGSGHGRVIFRHLLPNVISSIIVIGTLQISRMIIAEASLSFLGLGVQPPTPAWGSMVAQGRDYLFRQWWLSTIPGMAIMFTTLGVNLFGDALRDVLDPSMRGRR